MGTEVDCKPVRLLRYLNQGGVLVDLVVKGTKVLKTECNSSHYALSSVSGEKHGVWIATAVDEDGQLGLSEILYFIYEDAMKRPRHITDLLQSLVQVMHQFTFVE